MNNGPITQLDDQQRKVLPRIEAMLRLYDRMKTATSNTTLKKRPPHLLRRRSF